MEQNKRNPYSTYSDEFITLDKIVAYRSNGKEYLHRRIKNSTGHGSIVLARSIINNEVKFFFVVKNRPAPGLIDSIELPRGQTNNDSKDEINRELYEEMNIEIPSDSFIHVSKVNADTGLLGIEINVFFVDIPSQKVRADDFVDYESGARTLWLSKDEIFEYIESGKILCGITLSSLMVAQVKKFI